jgi:(E)-4-hydroxy-3-methylbut-2-enyl-diphosphate synthase
VRLMVESYRLLADTVDFPLHLGVTEAGPLPGGVLKGTAGIATLLNEGIGDTIRFSLTADPVEEVKVGKQLLEVLGLRERTGLDLIACPSCGRAEVDVIEVAANAQEALANLDIPIQVAVMGCVVNGPGEAKSADLGIAAGRQRGHLFVRGKVVKVVPEDKMVDSLVEWAIKISEAGIDGALADADLGAEAEAEADRAALMESQGEDVNSTEQAVEMIRRR